MSRPRLLAALCGALLCAPSLLVALDVCSKNPCHNNGLCKDIAQEVRGDVFPAYTCECLEGYVGSHCELKCAEPLGMENGNIANSQITASSVRVTFLGVQHWVPELARLNRAGMVNAWTPSSNDDSPWIQVNLLRRMWVAGVVTQGASRLANHEYLKTFKVAYSLNGHDFDFIHDVNQKHKEFTGNWNKNTVHINLFETPVEAQYVRLYPTSCHTACTLRFELLGCELNGCHHPLGLKNNSIPDKQITASSSYKTWGLHLFSWNPSYARLDKQGNFNAWVAGSYDKDQWLQVDLGSPKQVTGIITQGVRNFGSIQFVASYKVAYSNDSMNWTEYQDRRTGSSKIFPGNWDNHSHKKNVFETPVLARYVRVLPVAWHNRVALRLELLGC
ncbi:lactadherin isoform X1 [Aotus nancymaae]|uniref:lactadherin isoform X1 n=1 Tax=Aotus nancymaae TaxID=37293 RepID=UPI0030FE4668